MRMVGVIFRREFQGYFATPVAVVFLFIFLVLCGIFTFEMGGFFERGQADLVPFFRFLPWLFLFLIPAVAMRLWAEERRTGTIELLMTLPITMMQAVLGKFLAAWAFIGLALLLTLPLWATVNYLGNPDNGVVFASYIGAMLMAGSYLAIGSCMSSITKNQVIAFILSVVLCFVFVLVGLPGMLNFLSFLPDAVLETLRSFSILDHFQETIIKGVIDARDLIFFGTLIGCFLFMNAVIIELKKAD